MLSSVDEIVMVVLPVIHQQDADQLLAQPHRQYAAAVRLKECVPRSAPADAWCPAAPVRPLLRPRQSSHRSAPPGVVGGTNWPTRPAPGRGKSHVRDRASSPVSGSTAAMLTRRHPRTVRVNSAKPCGHHWQGGTQGESWHAGLRHRRYGLPLATLDHRFRHSHQRLQRLAGALFQVVPCGHISKHLDTAESSAPSRSGWGRRPH